jgi:hypothetical protein
MADPTAVNFITLMMFPSLAVLRIDRAEPHALKSRAEAWPPVLQKLRSDIVEPIVTDPKIET